MTNDKNLKIQTQGQQVRIYSGSFGIRILEFFRVSSFGFRPYPRSLGGWAVGWGTLGSPSPRPSPLGRGRMVHRFSIALAPEFSQRPLAKHQSDACCSLSLRERVR